MEELLQYYGGLDNPCVCHSSASTNNCSQACYPQSPVVNFSRVEQDVTDQDKTKTVRYLFTGVKLSLGSYHWATGTLKEEQIYYNKNIISVLAWYQFRTQDSNKLAVSNYLRRIYHLSFFTVSSCLFFVRLFVLLYKQTINNKHSLRLSKFLIQR